MKKNSQISFKTIFFSVSLFLALGFANQLYAATLTVSPSTGVYQSGSTFTVNVLVNTQGKPINAADATLTYNPREVSVVSVNRANSIFNLWVTEPAFSNSAGTITFSGGSPSGYTGSSGRVMSITFRTIGSGSTRVNFSGGSVLANDGKGTNVLTSMNGGNFTIQAASASPEPEVIEYVAPANTPAAPVIESVTHGDPAKWYASNNAKLAWSIPARVTSVRTLLDANPTSVPTKVYDNPINSIELDDLEEGVSYFHIQFRNEDGWGKINHYRLAVDTENPKKIEITTAEGVAPANPIQQLYISVEDDTSTVRLFKVKIDNNEPYDYIDETGSSTILLNSLEPGYHTAIIEGFDEAGNSIVGTYSFTIESFDRPVFTEYPAQISEDVIPVIKGLTRADSTVVVKMQKIGSEATEYSVTSDEAGEFVIIPNGRLTEGVYELTAVATDSYGAKSGMSEMVRIAVQQPGYVRIGSMLVNILSVVVPLVALILLGVISIWYLWRRMRQFTSTVRVESKEALDILHREFVRLQENLRDQESVLQNSRASKKLTKAEAEMIEQFDKSLQSAQRAVEKEIEDVQDLTNKK